MVKRGEVWLVALDPTIGGEIRKTRPCLVVSPDELNAHRRLALIAPMTTGSRPARFRAAVTFQGTQGLVLPDQVRTVDRDRFVKRLGRVDAETLRGVLAVLRKMFGE
jgi:mRNA interferase MazF